MVKEPAVGRGAPYRAGSPYAARHLAGLRAFSSRKHVACSGVGASCLSARQADRWDFPGAEQPSPAFGKEGRHTGTRSALANKLVDQIIECHEAPSAPVAVQNRRMSEKQSSLRGVTTFDVSKLTGSMSTIEAARYFPGSVVAAEFAAVQAALRPAEALRRQLEALAPTFGIRKAMEQANVLNSSLGSMRAAEFSAFEQVRRQAEAESNTAARFGAFDFAVLAKAKAIEELLTPSRLAAKYLEELASSRTLSMAAEQAARWRDPYKELTSALERFKEPMGLADARALLESMVKASQPFGVGRVLDEAALESESEATRVEVFDALHEVTASVASAPTLQDAIAQIVGAIERANDSPLRQFVQTFLVPLLLACLFSYVNSWVDFHVKAGLEASSKQAATKQVKETAREAVGDLLVLEDYRFVSAQHLTLTSSPKARAPVVGRLRFGQAVRVLEKDRDFTLVAWRSEDGKVVLQGWVFSRYLKRFG